MKNEIIEITVESKIRNEYTNGKFVTRLEYNRIIRKEKLKKIKKNQEYGK